MNWRAMARPYFDLTDRLDSGPRRNQNAATLYNQRLPTMWGDVIVELLKRPLKSGGDIAAAVRNLFEALAKEALRTLPAANRSCVRILDPADGLLRFVGSAGAGWRQELLDSTQKINQRSAGARAIWSKRPFPIDNVKQAEDYHE